MGFAIDESHLPYRLSDGLQPSRASVESPNVAANGRGRVLERPMPDNDLRQEWSWPAQENMNAAVSYDLIITLSGHIRMREVTGQGAPPTDVGVRKLVRAFSAGQAEGLFLLAAGKPDASLPSSFAFWRDLAGRYLTELCHAPPSAGKDILIV